MIARPRRVRVFSGALAVLFIAVFTVVAVLLRRTSTGVFFQVSDQVAMAGIGVLLACGALWMTWPKITADAAGVRVRNLLGSTTYPWSQVRGISFPDGAAWARLELPDDEYVPVMAVQALDGDRAVAAIRELRKLHRAATAPAE
ncbi:PH domain-containing protein [Actinokineospora sp. NBRC 105648]|uniref:PH domain-containing protein n=1 Tax=Actinokineospora sp. NBRC 105648 TaxID=3032206 RepID=UPI0024A3C57C|nr:PH domain-containing protein [Actinokineospora sp. NBRC 105648]GLZ36916.1 membrane protein [Actinokineospora sp. NBRC 105648]